MSTPTPSSADLLLAHHVRERAYIRRKFDIKQATGVSGLDPEYPAEVEKWDKGLDYYVLEVTEELKTIWRVMNGEKISLR